MSYEVLRGDCIEVMAQMEEASVDAVVCDPPAGISFMGKEWDRDKGGRDAWIEWLAEALGEALRICKPGAHAIVWALPRTSHWTALALEEAGWEIRDRIAHHFGNGFPKNKNLGGGIGTALKPATEDWWLARKPFVGSTTENFLEHGTGGINVDACRIGTNGGTTRSEQAEYPKNADGTEDRSQSWARTGHGIEKIAAGRWPANVVLSHLEECEAVGTKKVKVVGSTAHQKHHGKGEILNPGEGKAEHPGYRDEDGTETVEAWNCAPGCPVAELDAQSGTLKSGFMAAGTEREGLGYQGGLGNRVRHDTHGDSGGASRFFYVAKISRAEREAGLDGFDLRTADPYGEHRGRRMEDKSRIDGKPAKEGRNHHPTVKPINLMRWLVRLVTPPGGLILDPFLGSGSTGCAAVLEGFDFVGIERETDYIAIAEARVAFWAQHERREVKEVLAEEAKRKRRAKAAEEKGQAELEAVAA